MAYDRPWYLNDWESMLWGARDSEREHGKVHSTESRAALERRPVRFLKGEMIKFLGKCTVKKKLRATSSAVPIWNGTLKYASLALHWIWFSMLCACSALSAFICLCA